MRTPARGAVALAGVLLAACASSSGGESPTPASGGPPLPSTEPAVQMTSPRTGYLIWPTGSAWLVLATTDGFRHVRNRTPIAVDTGGGLVGAFMARRSAVAVGVSGRLRRSPVLTASGAAPWSAHELPGAVRDTRGAVTWRPAAVTPQLSAVISAHSGTVLLETRHGWTTLATGRQLDPRGRLTVDAVTWLGRRTAVLTGHGAAGTAVVFVSRDAGRSWQPVPGLPQGARAALAPCGSAAAWLMPVLSVGGHETELRTSDGGASWAAGRSFPAASGVPAWGCSGSRVWTVGQVHGQNRVLTSGNGGRSWRPAGVAPAALTSLSPTSNGTGFATTGGAHPALWAVVDRARRFVRLALPGWVASLGSGMPTS